MGQRTQETRQKLLEAARALFARRGLESVSLREITRAAGQSNVNALQYHFGDRETLLAEIVGPHHREVSARRHALLDEFEASADGSLRDLAGALVRPPAAMLDREGGREYLCIAGELVRQPDRFDNALLGFGSSMGRWRRLVGREISDTVKPLHRRFAAIQLTFSELARRAERARGNDPALFESNLIDLVTGVLATEVSSETRRLLAERGSGRRLAKDSV
jgi:AcrR family transcriptional regulator